MRRLVDDRFRGVEVRTAPMTRGTPPQGRHDLPVRMSATMLDDTPSAGALNYEQHICVCEMRRYAYGRQDLGYWGICEHDVLWCTSGWPDERECTLVLEGLRRDGWVTPAERGLVPDRNLLIKLALEARERARGEQGLMLAPLAHALTAVAHGKVAIHEMPFLLPDAPYELRRIGEELVCCPDWADDSDGSWRVLRAPWPTTKRGGGAWLAT